MVLNNAMFIIHLNAKKDVVLLRIMNSHLHSVRVYTVSLNWARSFRKHVRVVVFAKCIGLQYIIRYTSGIKCMLIVREPL